MARWELGEYVVGSEVAKLSWRALHWTKSYTMESIRIETERYETLSQMMRVIRPN